MRIEVPGAAHTDGSHQGFRISRSLRPGGDWSPLRANRGTRVPGSNTDIRRTGGNHSGIHGRGNAPLYRRPSVDPDGDAGGASVHRLFLFTKESTRSTGDTKLRSINHGRPRRFKTNG